MIWSLRRKVLGNLVPAAPIVAVVAAALATRDVRVLLYGGPAGLILAWLALNRWGFWDNARIRTELAAALRDKGERVLPHQTMVGFADAESPSSPLDAHGDIGFVFLEKDALRVRSESREIRLPWAAIRRLRFAKNPHSVMFLGRWLVIEAVIGGRPALLKLEPRDHPTMRANLRAGDALLDRLRERAVDSAP